MSDLPFTQNAKTEPDRVSAFAFIFTRSLRLWENHAEKFEKNGHLEAPAFLMLMRHDYRAGMFGGGLKDGQNIAQGLITELGEELGLKDITPDDLDPICAHEFSKPDKPATIYRTHLMGLEMSAQDFLHTHQNALSHAEHAPSEVRAPLLISMEDSAPGGHFERAMSLPTPPSLKSGLLLALKKYELCDEELITRLQAHMNQNPGVNVRELVF